MIYQWISQKDIMGQIGNVKEIIIIKNILSDLVQKKMIAEWELPYEVLLTRLSAAIFFFSLEENIKMDDVLTYFNGYENVKYIENTEKKLSQMTFRLEFK